jgi:DNA-binding GntR family transcriptional regulator
MAAAQLDSLTLQDKVTLPERIAATLRNAIIERRIEPGAHLVEQELVKRFGVSRVPLREAFRVLAGEGLVDVQPHRGAVVTALSESELAELFEVRAVLEGQAVRRLARMAGGEVLGRIEALLDEMKASVRRRDFATYLSQAARFHDLLVSESGNALLARLYDQIRLHLRRYQTVLAKTPESPRRSILEHARIVSAIRAGGEEAAERAARAHIGALVGRFQGGEAKASPGKRRRGK